MLVLQLLQLARLPSAGAVGDVRRRGATISAVIVLPGGHER